VEEVHGLDEPNLFSAATAYKYEDIGVEEKKIKIFAKRLFFLNAHLLVRRNA